MKQIYHNGLCMDTSPDCLCMSCENDGRREGFSYCEQNDPYMKHCPMTICANYKAVRAERGCFIMMVAAGIATVITWTGILCFLMGGLGWIADKLEDKKICPA